MALPSPADLPLLPFSTHFLLGYFRRLMKFRTINVPRNHKSVIKTDVHPGPMTSQEERPTSPGLRSVGGPCRRRPTLVLFPQMLHRTQGVSEPMLIVGPAWPLPRGTA